MTAMTGLFALISLSVWTGMSQSIVTIIIIIIIIIIIYYYYYHYYYYYYYEFI